MNHTPDLPGTSDEQGWHRLHWVTPLLRSWTIIAVGIAFFVQQGFDELTNLVFDPMPVPGVPVDSLDLRALLIILGVGVLIVLVIASWAFLSWRLTRYRVRNGVLEHEEGVLFRQQRRAPLDRLQAVDVVQPLIGRIFGLSELRLEVAGGAGSDVRLRFLRASHAERLRNTLLAEAAGVEYSGSDAPAAPEQPLVALPLGRLILALLLGWDWVISLLVIVAAAIAAFIQPGAILTIFPVVIGVGSAMWARFTRSFNFTAAISPDGLRLRHGLLETRTQTLPPGRVQAVELTQPLWWRLAGWWRLRVNVAGYTSGEGRNQAPTHILMPAATRDEAYLLLAQVLPDLGCPDPVALLDEGCTGSGDGPGFHGAPARAVWLDPVTWRRRGFSVTTTALLLRSGRLTRRLVLVPHERTQSLALVQGWLQRRLRLATVVAHSTPGPIHPQVEHLDQGVAARLLDEQASRARQARSQARAERWMQKDTPDEAPGPSM